MKEKDTCILGEIVTSQVSESELLQIFGKIPANGLKTVSRMAPICDLLKTTLVGDIPIQNKRKRHLRSQRKTNLPVFKLADLANFSIFTYLFCEK